MVQDSDDGMLDKPPSFWAEQQTGDVKLAALRNYLDTGYLPADETFTQEITKTAPSYGLVDGVLCLITRTDGSKKQAKETYLNCIPEHLKSPLITAHHNNASAHSGSKLTFRRMKLKYFWPTMFRDIRAHIRVCKACNERKVRNIPHKKWGGTSILPSEPGEVISMDIQYFNRKGTWNYALTLIDKFSRYAWAYPLKLQTAKEVGEVLLEHIMVWGARREMTSDYGSHFVNSIVEEIMKDYSIIHKLAIPYQPETSGTVERFHRTLGDHVAILLESAPKESKLSWEEALPFAMFAYNSTPRKKLQLQFFTMFGRHPIDPTLVAVDNTVDAQEASSFRTTQLQNHKQAKEVIRAQHMEEQEKRKKKLEAQRKPPIFEAGDRVLVEDPKRRLKGMAKDKMEVRRKRAKIMKLVHPGRYQVRFDSGYKRFAAPAELTVDTTSTITQTVEA